MRWTRGRLLLLALLVAALGAAFFFWRGTTPPLAARLLPESQAILYIDLSPLRAATRFNQKPVAHDVEYQQFIDRTGIDAERDLDEVAVALEHLPDADGPNGGLGFCEVFAGRFDPVRLARYLAGIAASTETYAGRTVYEIPSQGRTVRVALLPRDMVAVSNTPTPEQIHSMLDRARTAWLPVASGEPSLLAEHYRDLPALSLAWGLGEIGLPFGDHGQLSLFGLTLPFRLNAVFVASLRWTGVLRLRLEEIAPNETAARATAGALSGLLSLGSVTQVLPRQAVNDDLQTVLSSAAVTQHEDRAVLNMTLPEKLLRELVQTHGSF